MGWGSGNLGGGSGAAKLPAIYAQYPKGSVCTCTNGSKTFTAKDTSGFWLFAGLELGTWTVTATDGEQTTSVVAEITSEGQSVNVELSYVLWLYNEGVFAPGQAWGAAKKGPATTITQNASSVKVVVNSGGYYYVRFAEPVDLTYRTKIIMRVQSNSAFNNTGTQTWDYGIGIFVTQYTDGQASGDDPHASSKTLVANKIYELTLDVSALSGEYVVNPMFAYGTATGTINVDILSVGVI